MRSCYSACQAGSTSGKLAVTVNGPSFASNRRVYRSGFRWAVACVLVSVAACGPDQRNDSSSPNPSSTRSPAMTPESGDPASSVPRGHVDWDPESISVDGNRVTIRFPGGRPFNTDDPCSTQYTAVVDEQPDAITVKVESWSPVPPPGVELPQGCSAEGYERYVEFELAAALGDREVRQG